MCEFYDQEATMQATDKTILIQCSDCAGVHMEEGFDAMVDHIKSEHPEYHGLEINSYALKWMEAAYDREDKFLQDYYDERKIERAIEADREFQTHKI